MVSLKNRRAYLSTAFSKRQIFNEGQNAGRKKSYCKESHWGKKHWKKESRKKDFQKKKAFGKNGIGEKCSVSVWDL